MRKLIKLSLLLFCVVGMVSCLDEEKENSRKIIDQKKYVINVASQKINGLVNSGNAVPTEVFAIKKEGIDYWEPLYGIDGFVYEAGYEYKIKIQETSYLDFSMGTPVWTEYKLIELISKEQKSSENLPTDFYPEWYTNVQCTM